MKNVVLTFCILMSLSSSGYAESQDPLASAKPSQIILSGRFNPSTLEHTGLLAKLMVRLGIHEGQIYPLLPKDPSKISQEQIQQISAVAVGKFSETLDAHGIPYAPVDSVSGEEPTSFVWRTDRSSAPYRVTLNSNGLKAGIGSIAQAFLAEVPHASEQNTFWIIGGEKVKELAQQVDWVQALRHGHLIIVPRPSQDAKAVAIIYGRENPLAMAFGPEFLSRYAYRWDKNLRRHVYQPKNGGPWIYVMDIPTQSYTGEAIRESLNGDMDLAQSSLAPSVFRLVAVHGWYREAGAGVYTEENLRRFLLQYFSQLQSPLNASLTPEESADFLEMIDEMVQLATRTAQESKDKPAMLSFFATVYEQILEPISNLRDFRKLKRKATEVAQSYGLKNFAITFLVAEALEMTVVPWMMYHFGGVQALLLAPFIHPNEFLVMPGFVAYNLWKIRQKKRQLADGDFRLYQALKMYRDVLMRRDPDVASVQNILNVPLGLNGAALSVQIVKSRLPSWIPRALRQRWDANAEAPNLYLATQELIDILADKNVSAALKNVSQNSAEIFAQLLWAAVLAHPQKRWVLFYRLCQRYFALFISSGFVSEDLTALTADEQLAVQALRQDLTEFIPAGSLYTTTEFANLTASVFALQRVLTLNPDALTMLQQDDLARGIVQQIWPAVFRGAISVTSSVAASSAYENVKVTSLRAAVTRFVRGKMDAFLSTAQWEAEERYLFSPSPISDDLKQTKSLVWKTELFLSALKSQAEKIKDVFDEHIRYVSRSGGVRRQYAAQLARLEQQLNSVKEQLTRLEFRFLRLKLSARGGYPIDFPEESLPGFAELSGGVDQQMAAAQSILTQMNQLSLAVVGAQEATAVEVSRLRDFCRGLLGKVQR